MLIPKGTPDGLRSELFVMVSNYEEGLQFSISEALFFIILL